MLESCGVIQQPYSALILGTRPAAAWWTAARNIWLCSFIVIYTHGFALQFIGSIAMPALAGVRLPEPPGVIDMTAIAVALGCWRLLADRSWKQRLLLPRLNLLVAASLIMLSTLLYNAMHGSGLKNIQSQYFPFVMFGVGLLAGVSRKCLDWTLIVLAIFNDLVTTFVGLFYLEPYRVWMQLLTQLALNQGIPLIVSKDISQPILVPTGIMLGYIPFGVFHLFCGALLLDRALDDRTDRRLKLLCGVLSAFSIITLFLTLDRSNTATALVIYIALLVRWYLRGGLKRSTAASGRLRVAAGLTAIAVGLIAMAVAGSLLLKSRYDVELLSTRNLVGSTQSARFVLWGRVLEDISRQNGWLTGIHTQYRQQKRVVPNSAPAYSWSERAYYTIDNAYLTALANSGIIGLAAMIGFFWLAGWQLRCYRCWGELTMLAGFAVVYSTLESNWMPYALVFLVSGARLGDLVQAEQQERLTRQELSVRLVVVT